MKNNNILKVLSLIAILSVVMMIYVVSHQNTNTQFIPPVNDAFAISGLPNGEYTISKLSEYEFGINPHPYIQSDNIYINLYNGQDNDILMKVRVLKDDKVVGESGIINPGESIEVVKLDQEVNEQSELIYKIMCYEKETYYSAGSGIVRLDTSLLLK